MRSLTTIVAALLAAVLTTALGGRPVVQHAPPAVPRTPRGAEHRPSFPGSATDRFAPQRVLVAPTAGTTAERMRDVTDRVGGRLQGVLPGSRVRAIRLPPALGVAEAVRRYERSAAVRFAEPDYLVRPSRTLQPNDPGYSSLYAMENTGQTGGVPDADIDAPQAWSVTTGSSDTVVAVIDTGVDITHPDLAGNVWTNPGEVPGNGVDDDGNGYVDDVHGWDFYHGDNTVYDGAEDSHGTHVAGTIAAVGGNGIGVTGVSWRAQIMPLKFLGPDVGYTSDAIAALDYAVANGARISNNSWGGSGYSQALAEAIARAGAAGHLVVAAAGNGGSDGIGDDIDVTPSYPASYDADTIVSVAATDDADMLAGFSNYGRTSVDLAAPGVRIESTLPGSSYGSYSGTSMATPHVTGAAALVLSDRPGLAPRDLKKILLSTTDPRPSLGATVSGGRLNVGRALDRSVGSTLSLSVRPGTLTYGATTSVSGRLTADGEGLGGQAVIMQRRTVGTTRWRALSGGLLSTAADGGFTLTGVRPGRSTDYRVRYPGSAGTAGPTVSSVRRANVRVRVTLRLDGRDLALGHSRVIAGSVRPAHSGSVRLVVRRNGAVAARRTVPLDDDSHYRFRYRPRRAGRYTFTAVRFADADHLSGRSPTKGFLVVR